MPMQHPRIRFDLRRGRTIRNAVDHDHRIHPLRCQNRLDGGESSALMPRSPRPLRFDQTENHTGQDGQRRGYVRDRRQIHFWN